MVDIIRHKYLKMMRGLIGNHEKIESKVRYIVMFNSKSSNFMQ